MFGVLKKSSLYWISLIAFLALLSNELASAKQLPKQKPEEGTKTEQPVSPYERGTKDLPVIVEIAPSAPLKVETDHDKEAENEKAYDDWLIARGTVALAVVTSVLAVATIGLMIFTYRLWRATHKLVEGTDDTAKKQLRAYVGIDAISAIHANPLSAQIRFKNFGKTIAKDVIFSVSGRVNTVGEMAEFPFSNHRGATIIMPTESSLVCESIECDGGDWGLIQQGIGYVYVWGKITYKDVFGDSHWTQFRMMTDQRSGMPWQWTFKYCQDGNNALVSLPRQTLPIPSFDTSVVNLIRCYIVRANSLLVALLPQSSPRPSLVLAAPTITAASAVL